jgi:hypothetical protein
MPVSKDGKADPPQIAAVCYAAVVDSAGQKPGTGMRWSREHKIGCTVVCGLGATLGLFVGFIVFAISVRSGTGAAFSFWIQRPGLYWPWPTFGGAIAGLDFYAVWILRRPRQQDAEKPSEKSRVDAYHSLIAKAVSQLPTSDHASRGAIYNRARNALADHSSKEEFKREHRALETAIRKFERDVPQETIKLSDPRHRPTTTLLVISILFFPRLWLIDVTCMSLYGAARLPKL